MHEAGEISSFCGEDLDRDLADLLDARYARSGTIPDQGHLLENDDDISLFGSGCTLPARTDRVSVTILVAVRDRSVADKVNWIYRSNVCMERSRGALPVDPLVVTLSFEGPMLNTHFSVLDTY
jgi:hypothetical protein